MSTLHSFLNKISSIPVLIVFTVLFIVCIVFVLPRQKAATEVYSREAGSVGLSFFPAPEKVYTMAKAYGQEGRRAYITVWLTYQPNPTGRRPSIDLGSSTLNR